jgi:hypothetical protein
MVLIINAQGRNLCVRRERVPLLSDGRSTGGKRGEISTFSKASRKRLLRLANALQVVKRQTSFLTLTYSSNPSHEQAKRDLHVMIQWFRDNHPQASAIWRMEYQKSGKIHFHFIIYNIPYIKQKMLQKTWTKITGESRSIVDIRAVKNAKHALIYVSKYIAKVHKPSQVVAKEVETPASNSPCSLDIGAYSQKPESTWVGRFWGYINKHLLPFAPMLEIEMQEGEESRYFLWAMWAMSKGKCGLHPSSRWLFTEESYAMTMYALAIG